MADERYYLVCDLRLAAGVSRTTMNFYIRQKLITPTDRSENGFLLFNAQERDRLLKIVEWRRKGYGLKQIKEILAQEVPE
jgi:MerR family Zn(II)-responsive transcriptional regulator of zntA